MNLVGAILALAGNVSRFGEALTYYVRAYLRNDVSFN